MPDNILEILQVSFILQTEIGKDGYKRRIHRIRLLRA